MKLTKILSAIAGALAVSACASGGTTEATPAASPPPPAAAVEAPAAEAATSATATFTDVQADRGRDLFRAACTECHYSSEFADPQFKFKWGRRTAGSLYQMIQTQMPESDPGILTPEQTVDLVTYILRMNGFEPGSGELAADRAVLDEISLASIRTP